MKFFLSLFLLAGFQLYAQNDLTQIPGKLYHDSRPEANRPGIRGIFQTMEKLSFINAPKGMHIQENYISYNKQGDNGKLLFSMNQFYKDGSGNIKANTDEPPAISVVLNKPDELMDANSIFYNGEDFGKALPIMFTDTFEINYVEMNGFLVGQTLDTRFKNKKFVLNPKQTALFRFVTQEEYLKYFIATLKKQIAEDSVHQTKMKAELAPLRNNPSFKTTLADIESINEAMLKYFGFMKKKKQFYEKKLAMLSPAEKNAPAYRLGHKDLALPMKNGKPVEEISGHLEYEPTDDNEDLLFKIPVFTFSENFSSTRLPKGAIQLIVIKSPFIEGDVGSMNNPLKKLVEKEVIPLISYRELAGMMYQ